MNEHEKRLRAAALKYRAEDAAPKVTAIGAGIAAKNIIETAKSSGIVVHKDERLMGELTKLDIGENIPPDLYEVVAQILIFIGDLDKLMGDTRR